MHLNSGVLKHVDKLRSARRISMQLGVHCSTIAEAYQQLAKDPWIHLRHWRMSVVYMEDEDLPRVAEDAELPCH